MIYYYHNIVFHNWLCNNSSVQDHATVGPQQFGPPKHKINFQDFSLDAGGSETILHGQCWFYGQHEGECLVVFWHCVDLGYPDIHVWRLFPIFPIFRTQVVVDVGGVPLTLQSTWPLCCSNLRDERISYHLWLWFCGSSKPGAAWTCQWLAPKNGVMVGTNFKNFKVWVEGVYRLWWSLTRRPPA